LPRSSSLVDKSFTGVLSSLIYNFSGDIVNNQLNDQTHFKAKLGYFLRLAVERDVLLALSRSLYWYNK